MIGTIGVIGAGQLGRMLALAGIPLNLEFIFLDPAPTPSAAGLGEHIRAEFNDPAALNELARAADVITYEFENVDVAHLNELAKHTSLRPGTAALRFAQDRREEKRFFERCGLPVASWHEASTQEELEEAVASLSPPLIVKTAKMGYDGKGQRQVHSSEDAVDLFGALGDVPLVIEKFVDFDYEVSLIATRALDGETRFYPLTRNEHRNGILLESRALPGDHSLHLQAEQHMRAVTESLDYIGTMAIEFFVCGDKLLGNEFAPRVHNSGHWTIEGAACSQFENHLRAICGLPLGHPEVLNSASMLNLIGAMPNPAELLAIAGLRLHDYGKSPRPGRKLGHATIIADNESSLANRTQRVAEVLRTL